MALLHIEDIEAYLAIGFGVYCIVRLVLAVRKARTFGRWPRTTGVITRSEVKEGWNVGTGSALLSLDWLYATDIAYEYLVGGRAYNGSTVNYVPIATSVRSWAEKKVGRYPVGKTVDVWYDPANPGESVLERGVALWALLLLGVAGVAALVLGTLGALHVMAF